MSGLHISTKFLAFLQPFLISWGGLNFWLVSWSWGGLIFLVGACFSLSLFLWKLAAYMERGLPVCLVHTVSLVRGWVPMRSACGWLVLPGAEWIHPVLGHVFGKHWTTLFSTSTFITNKSDIFSLSAWYLSWTGPQNQVRNRSFIRHTKIPASNFFPIIQETLAPIDL